jgi:uncharacterized YigZ family protein
MTTPVRYPVPAARHRVEIAERRSRFIATVGRCATVGEARAFVDAVRTEMPDATHHAYAFAVGFGGTVTCGMSDAGEPPGTAGRPTLAVVQGSGLGDVCVVVTRYFGGTKLGTGGLVRAYTAAAQLALAEVPRAMREERQSVVIAVPYAVYESCARLVAAHDGQIEAEDFGAEVTLRASLATDRLDAFAAALSEVTAGRVVTRPVGDGAT